MPQRLSLVDVGLALAWVLGGVAVAFASWRMDRLTQLGIDPYSVPGLVPGIIGVAIAVLGAMLAVREWRAGSAVNAARVASAGSARNAGSTVNAGSTGCTGSTGSTEGETPEPPLSIGRAAAAGLLSIVFAGFVLGHGLPFAVTSGVFIFLFVMLFGRADLSRKGQGIARTLVVAALIAAAAATFIAFLFGEVFLVRLP